MDLFGFICILSFPFSVIVLVALVLITNNPLSLLSLEIGLLLLLIGYFTIRIHNRKHIKKMDDTLLSFSKKISSFSGKKEKSILFKRIDGYWTCEQFNKKYFFNLDGIFFKKSFIIAFITRAIRYPFISYQKKVKELGKIRFKIPYKRMPLNVVFIDNGKKTTHKLIKNNTSSCSFFAWGITWLLLTVPSKYKKKSKLFSYQTMKLDEYIFRLFI